MHLLLIIAILSLLGFAYWKLLRTLYPEATRADETHTLKTRDGWSLRLLRRKPASGEGAPVLLVHGAAGNHVYFESPKGRSLVETLSAGGYDCWTLELRGYRSSTPPVGHARNEVTIDDYLLKDIPSAVEFIREQTGYESVHYIGHSMGGMLMYAYELTFGRDHIASAVALGAPAGFEGVSFGGVAGLEALVRVARRPVEIVFRAAMPLLRALRIPYRGMPVNWDNVTAELDTGTLFNGIEVPPPNVLEKLNHWAVTKTWRMRDGNVDVAAGLKLLETPLFVVVGGADPFTPVGPVKAFFEALPGKDKELLVLSKAEGKSADYSHIDMVVGKNSQEELFEPIVKWFNAHPIRARNHKDEQPLVPMPVKVAEERIHPEAEHAVVEEAVVVDVAPAEEEKAVSEEKPTVRKSAAAKKPAAKKVSAKKSVPATEAVASTEAVVVTEKGTTKMKAANKVATAKAPAKKIAVTKTASSEATSKKAATVKKAATKKSAAKKSETTKPASPTKPAQPKKPAAKKAAATKKPAAAKKPTAVKKAVAKAPVAKKAAAKKLGSTKRRSAAEKAAAVEDAIVAEATGTAR